MDTLTAFFTLGSILGGVFLLWMNTKPGKRWLANL